MSKIKEIAVEHLSYGGEGFTDSIDRGNRWMGALIDGGIGPHIENEYGNFSGDAVVHSSQSASESEIAEVEATLGFLLPPSYRAFLLEIGGLSFLNYWWDETTPIGCLVEESLRVRDEIVTVHGGSSPLVRACTPLQLIRFCDFQNHAGEFIFIGNFRDEHGENPEFLWFHDDVFGGQADLDWMNRVQARVSRQKDRELRKEGTTDPVMTPRTGRVNQILASDSTQREKMRGFETLLSDLSSAQDVELITALHAIRKGINSKKLKESRDSLIGQLRRDGEPGSFPLPTLRRPHPVSSSAPSCSESFSTFGDWLSGHVDRMIEETTEVLSKNVF